jgi:hypothetical protein
MLQKAGGLFQVLADIDFGTSFGIKSLYYKTRTAGLADAGQFRLAVTDVINWRNNAGGGNLSLGVSATDVLQFNGVDIQSAVSVSDTATIDLTLTGTTISADIIAGSITNSLINAAAAIDFSKLATLASGNILVGSAGGVVTSVAMSGDATIIASGLLTIANNAVTNAKLAQMAQSTIKGRAASSGTGDPVDLTATQATAILNNFVGDSGSGGTKGLVPAPAAGDAATGKFLKADGAWTVPSGGGTVVGPVSSTDNALVVWDGVTGQLVKNSVVIYTTGALSGITDIANSGTIITDGSIKSKTSLILEDPGAGTNTVTHIAGIVSSSYSITWPTAVAAASNSVLVSSNAGVLTYVVAASANTASAIVQRDGSGNFAAGIITATLTGNVTGDLTGNVTGNVTGTASGNTTYSANNHGVVLSSSTNAMTVLAPDASTVKALISGGASANPAWGVLAIGGGGTGQATKAAAFDALSPMSAGGDIIYGGASGTGTRLPNGNAGQLLQSAGGTSAPVWFTPAAISISLILRGNADSIGGSSSGDTKTVNFSAAITSTGSDITFTARTTTTSDKYTINTTGVYSIWFNIRSTTGLVAGITLNSSDPSNAPNSLADNQLIGSCILNSGTTNGASVTLPLTAGDVIRVQSEGATANLVSSAYTRFGIARVG